MKKLTKNQKAVREKFDQEKEYSLDDASKLLKEISFSKFDESVDISVRLGVDPKIADQMVRGVVALPNGTGKEMKVLALVTEDKEDEAKDAGADYVGLDEFIKKIEKGWTDIDVIVTMPTVMAKVGKLGRVLGPRGLMPNPKSGTVTLEVGKAIAEVKAGKIDFKVDKFGIINASIGKVSFSAEKILENAIEILNVIAKLKPASTKGTYFKSINISSTMSPGITIDKSSVSGIKT
jgi:large subunit ribosomal protein L1